MLNYAQDVAAMERMCRNVHRSLKPGAEFFALMQSPDFVSDGPSLEKYGFLCEATREETETGPRFRATALLDPPIEIIATAPRREVYEHCLRAAGFGEPTWVPVTVSDAGVRCLRRRLLGGLRSRPPA